MTGRSPSRRRGSAMFVVIWAIAIGAVVLSSVQLFGYRQAMLGRQAVGRLNARWAARGGIEYTIAVLADHTREPVPGDAKALARDLDYIYWGDFEADGRLLASYDIQHHADRLDWRGPMDEHSKLNINGAIDEPSLITNLDDMYPDVADAIFDWIDDDDEERPLGAERHYYMGLSTPYEPRNAPMRTVGELELVAGIWPEHLRGEDWNLNNRLDPNEDDGERTWPPDEPDGEMEGGWAALFTTHSVTGGPGHSGLPRIDLRTAEASAVVERLEFDDETAGALTNWARGADASLEQLLVALVERMREPEEPVGIGRDRNNRAQAPDPAGPDLTADELRLVFAECTIGDPAGGLPGRLNINTVSEDLLMQLLRGQEHLADEILYLRARPQGIVTLVDLTEIPAFQEDTAALERVGRLMTTWSNVFSVAAVGRAAGSGVEVEINVVLDRSTLPVRILEYRE